MDLLEHDGKTLFARYDLPVPHGEFVRTAAHAVAAVTRVKDAVLKVQIYAGHRGKRGGIVRVSAANAAAQAQRLLDTPFDGVKPAGLLVERYVEIAEERYLALTIDRHARALVVLATRKGGVDVEADPGSLERYPLPLTVDARASIVTLAGAKHAETLGTILDTLIRLAKEQDATLVEVNPLAITKSGELLLLDSKVTIDDSALFRHPDLAGFAQQKTGLEQEALEANLAYVALDGNVAIVGNGAGLVMATLDAIKAAGATPANFLDVGGGAPRERVARAVNLALRQPHVSALLVNVFGGITLADEAAQGVIDAVGTRPAVPVVVRLSGHGAQRGRGLLKAAGLPVVESLESAAKHVVESLEESE